MAGATLKAAVLAAVGLAIGPGASALDLQGHRGARGLAPENTLPAFAKALSLGVTTLEMDAAVTHDHVVVISHDARLNPDLTRDHEGGWIAAPGPPIRALSLTQLRTYDVGRMRPGSEYAGRFPAQVPVDGTHIPTLAEVIQLAHRAGNERVRFNVETKIDPGAPELTLDPAAFADALVRTLRDGRVSTRATVQSFDWRTLQRVQAIAPEIGTVYLSAQRAWQDNLQAGRIGPSPWTAGFDIDAYGGSPPRLVQAAGGRIWSPYWEDAPPARIDEAHALGLRVIVWTVNDARVMRELIEAGVDGIITDYPDRLREVMAEMGLALPAATPVEP